jgi:PRTRC genetic system protein B
MAEIQTPTGDQLVAHTAILLYQSGAEIQYASQHDIRHGEIQPGKPLELGQVQALAHALTDLAVTTTRDSFDVLFESTLLMSNPLVRRAVWYRPAAPASQFYDCEELGKMQGVVNMPTLVFDQQGGGLRICAIRGVDRPTADTPIFHAPMFNTDQGGNVCLGDVALQLPVKPELRAANQERFLHGINTHPNGRHRKTTYEHGLFALWRDLVQAPQTPWNDDWLAPMGTTLGSWISARG